MIRFLPFFIFCFINLSGTAQAKKSQKISNDAILIGKYLCFNPFGLLESQMAIGAGAGSRFSERSEVFAELSYLGNHPFYKYTTLNFYHGARLLAQYRYHFLQRWKPLINLGRFTKAQREAARKRQDFIGLEFRFKPARFSAYGTFINTAIPDTLNKFNYIANLQSIGGAIIFGSTYKLSANGNLMLEITAGIGARQKFVQYKNVPEGYKVSLPPPREWNFIPEINDPVGVPYLPCTIRLRYNIR